MAVMARLALTAYRGLRLFLRPQVMWQLSQYAPSARGRASMLLSALSMRRRQGRTQLMMSRIGLRKLYAPLRSSWVGLMALAILLSYGTA
jgi:hypothetical protein